MAIKAYGIGFSYAGLSNILIMIISIVISVSQKKPSGGLDSYKPVIYLSVLLSAFALALLLLFFREEPFECSQEL